jgi:hypothetical protein
MFTPPFNIKFYQPKWHRQKNPFILLRTYFSHRPEKIKFSTRPSLPPFTQFNLKLFQILCFMLFFINRGTSGIDIDLRRVDIDQCPQKNTASATGVALPLNIFAGTDKCKQRTTEVSEGNFLCLGFFPSFCESTSISFDAYKNIFRSFVNSAFQYPA